LVILPDPHELGACRRFPPQVANLRNLERGKLVRGAQPKELNFVWPPGADWDGSWILTAK